MLRTFNCGVGMIAIVAPTEAETLIAHLNAAGETAFVAGALVERADAPVTFEGTIGL
jgi:phosphoribosylformylglycinamidine cyclo-ligase